MIRKEIAKHKARFDRGYYWSKYVRDFLILGLIMFQFGIPIWLLVLILPMVYVSGYVDERYGIWKAEREYNLQNISQFKKELFGGKD